MESYCSRRSGLAHSRSILVFYSRGVGVSLSRSSPSFPHILLFLTISWPPLSISSIMSSGAEWGCSTAGFASILVRELGPKIESWLRRGWEAFPWPNERFTKTRIVEIWARILSGAEWVWSTGQNRRNWELQPTLWLPTFEYLGWLCRISAWIGQGRGLQDPNRCSIPFEPS